MISPKITSPSLKEMLQKYAPVRADGAPDAAPNWNNLPDGINTAFLPSYKKGGVVKQTGPALLHKGERVIPVKKGTATAKKRGRSGRII